MVKKIINGFWGLSLLISPMVVLAETDGAMERPEEIRVQAVERKTATQDQMEDRREFRDAQITEKKGILMEQKESLQALKEERQVMIQKAKEEFRARMAAQEEALKSKLESRKADFKAKLATIKDEKKKAAVERLANKFTEINAKLVKHWGAALDRMVELLNKIASRADKLEADGQSVAAARTAITNAEAAIGTARTALEQQAAKAYTIAISTEDQLRSNVAIVRNTLNQDLQTVKELIRSAHRAVVEAIKSLKSVPRSQESLEGDE